MEQRFVKIFLIDVGSIIILTLYYFLYQFSHIGIPCPFHQITGLLCPGCGITRCLFSIMRFDFLAAFNYNPFVCLILPFLILYCCLWQYLYVKDRLDILPQKIINSISIVLIVVALAFGVIRNL